MNPKALLLDVVVGALYPIMLAASVWILLRGHNEPGGGFVGGMVAVAATGVLGVARGLASAQQWMPLGPTRLAAAGVLLSLASGLPAAFSGLPYMTHLWAKVPVGIATVDVSTVMLFDLGVYLTVWGALGGLVSHAIALGEEDER